MVILTSPPPFGVLWDCEILYLLLATLQHNFVQWGPSNQPNFAACIIATIWQLFFVMWQNLKCLYYSNDEQKQLFFCQRLSQAVSLPNGERHQVDVAPASSLLFIIKPIRIKVMRFIPEPLIMVNPEQVANDEAVLGNEVSVNVNVFQGQVGNSIFGN